MNTNPFSYSIQNDRPRITQIRLDRKWVKITQKWFDQKWVKGGYRELDQKSPPFIKGDLGLPAIALAQARRAGGF
jgi:hypothetical protein